MQASYGGMEYGYDMMYECNGWWCDWRKAVRQCVMDGGDDMM